jgi:hypothetical protein
VQRALATELRAAQDANHPMRFLLRKSSPRLATAKEIYETRDGSVARLLSVNGKPLDADQEQEEQARLDALSRDPNRQRHRKQAEEQDTARALNILRALPAAFLYQYAGPVKTSAGMVEKFTFQPNPRFSPPDLESEVLTALSGEIWIAPEQQRVVKLEGSLEHDMDFGWGILGRLNKGGWIVIEQADVGENQWRTVYFRMVMSGRVVFKNRVFDTEEEQTRFSPLPAGMDYRQAIQMLRAQP